MLKLEGRLNEEKYHFPYGCILMASPLSYNVKYKINPWMRPGTEDRRKAIRQWNILRNTISRLGAFVEVLPPTKFPDFVFTANAGLVHKNKFVLSKFKHKERRCEETKWDAFASHFANEYDENIFTVVRFNGKDFYFEGAGDWLPIYGKEMYVAGNGFRSTKESNIKIAKYLDVELIHMKLVDPNFYHLDTCFCPLNNIRWGSKNPTAIAYPGAFCEKDYDNLRKKFDIIEVCKEEAEKFACNAVVLGNQIIIPAGCPKLTKTLRNNWGFQVYPVELSEFIKSGGAAKCLTLKLY